MIIAQLPTILTVIITAVIDAVNPCAIGVLILMLSVIVTQGRSIRRMVWLGTLYISAVFLVYLAAGLGLTYALAQIPLALTEYLSLAVALLVILAGILEIKDFFWYGRGFSLAIPLVFSRKLEHFAQRTTVIGVVLLGAFVSLVELPCTGAPYLAIITLLSQYWSAQAFLLLVLYNLIFISPLIVILALVASGLQLHHLKAWKEQARGKMRLAIGLLLIALGWLLILIANGTINLG